MKNPAQLRKKKINLRYIHPVNYNSGNKNKNFYSKENGTILVKSFRNKIDKPELIEIFGKYVGISKIEKKTPIISFIEFKNKISNDSLKKIETKFSITEKN